MIEPLKRLRIVLLKRVAQAIGESRLAACQSTALLNHGGPCTHGSTLRLQWFKSFWMTHYQIQCEFGIGRIIFGPA
jgi:hypothetical protein